MAFTGFSDDAFEFYEGLGADNSKSYWTAHKKVYESAVRDPMQALFAELEAEFGAAKLFRPYRDVRFSTDKSPYKTQQGAHTSAGHYCAIDADGLMVGAGLYGPSAQQLARYRAAVDAERSGKALEVILEDLRASGYELSGERLKTRPRGVAEDHPRLDLLRYRSIYAHKGWPPEAWMHTPEVVDRVRQAWRGLRPLLEWCGEHAGGTEPEG